MQVDYEPRQKQQIQRRWFRRVAMVIAFIIATSATYLGLGFYRQIISERRQIQQFEQKTSEAKFFGKTADQIIASLGQPDGQEKFSDGGRDLVYVGPYDVACRFEVRSGVVTHIERWSK
jgi:hypothetical protein